MNKKIIGHFANMIEKACLQKMDPEGKRKVRFCYAGIDLSRKSEILDVAHYIQDNIPNCKLIINKTNNIFEFEFNNVVLVVHVVYNDDIQSSIKFRNTEYTGVIITEHANISQVDDLTESSIMRCGRYPALRNGGPTWAGVIVDDKIIYEESNGKIRIKK